MSTADLRRIREEERKRKKKLLRAFREEEIAKVWSRIQDEVGPCSGDEPEPICDGSEALGRTPDNDFEELDEDFPNKAETMHNLYECD